MPSFPQLPNDALEVFDLRLASLAFEKQIWGKDGMDSKLHRIQVAWVLTDFKI